MSRSKIQSAFDFAYEEYAETSYVSDVQQKAARDILACHTEKCGCNISICDECGYQDIHYNSCRNRNCPNCQAVLKELWIDARKSEVIDGAYFHAVFTIPHELNPLVYSNQKLLYSLLHKCASQTILELAADPNYLGAKPAIIQVLHTWGQTLSYHPHIHAIVSGAGLAPDGKMRFSGDRFFIPIHVVMKKFRGKFLALLQQLRDEEKLTFAGKCEHLKNTYEWNSFRNSLYSKDWCPFIKETFNGFGNAIEYLGRYAHRIAITNTRIQSVSNETTSFSAKDYRTGKQITVSLDTKEFVRRLLMHVLPSGFQKIRYYGLLNNRSKSKNLKTVFTLQRHRKFKSMYQEMAMDELLMAVWNYDIHKCPCCEKSALKHSGLVFRKRE